MNTSTAAPTAPNGPAPDPTAPGRHVPVALRWSDMDAYGHVNNVQYLRLMEEARIQVLRGGPAGTPSMLDSGLVVAHAEAEYLVPLVFRHEPVDVRVWLTDLAAASFDLAYEFTAPPSTTVHARGATRLVPYDLQAGRPRRLGAEERSRLEALRGPAPVWQRRPRTARTPRSTGPADAR